jgi:hypothetical protein
MHGTPVFRCTRVPVKTLVDYLENGESLNDFLKGIFRQSSANSLPRFSTSLRNFALRGSNADFARNHGFVIGQFPDAFHCVAPLRKSPGVPVGIFDKHFPNAPM